MRKILYLTIIIGGLLFFYFFPDQWGNVLIFGGVFIFVIAIITNLETLARFLFKNKSSVRPNAWFVLISGTTLGLGRHVTEYSTKLIVLNGSKFKILFYFKIDWKINGKLIDTQTDRWKDDPLHIYPEHSNIPGRGEYPDLIKIKDVLKGRNIEGVNELVADIQYRVAPSYAPNDKQEDLPETWRFDLTRKIWIGPNGVEDRGFI